jgi:hypothetical protein
MPVCSLSPSVGCHWRRHDVDMAEDCLEARQMYITGLLGLGLTLSRTSPAYEGFIYYLSSAPDFCHLPPFPSPINIPPHEQSHIFLALMHHLIIGSLNWKAL